MQRIKQAPKFAWLTWEGDAFPRNFHSDSIVFYTSEHIEIDSDPIYLKTLATSILREGFCDSLGEAYKLISLSSTIKAGYRLDDGDDRYLVYCDNDDPDLEFDATFVEIAYVD